MARTKKAVRESSYVTLRTKKAAKGRQSLYLDIYKDGKRSYQFLKLYLVPETSEAAKTLNKNTMLSATAIKNELEVQIIQGKGGIEAPKASKIKLLDWLQRCKQEKEKTGQSNSNALNIGKLIEHIKSYKGDNVTMAEVDEAFCKGFIDYLSKAPSRRSTKTASTLSKNTASQYFQYLSIALHEAERKGIIQNNPTSRLNKEDKKPIKASKAKRGYLVADEIEQLINTPCSNEQVKKAFLFSCFTGLRISDIMQLKWENIKEENGNLYIELVMQKTRKPIKLKLNKNALSFLPEKQGDFVFTLPIHVASIDTTLRNWGKKAGLEKRLSFHISRHSFSVSAITAGVDLYTVSKLLGHEKLTTTEIYADIISKKRDEALDKLDNMFNQK